jgi:hypothetical protein
VWLALLHALHLPYLISGAALWCGAALLAAFAFSTLWRKKDPAQGRVLTLGLFAALAFLPSSWAAYTLRVYRDNIFPALCLYFFAGMAGMALRAVLTPEKPLWPWLAAAGAGLACGYLDREDAGLFLLPFAAAATVIVAVVLAGKRRWKALAAQVIPYVMLGVGVLTFCTLNYTHYGVFALSDFSEGSFAAAMGAMMRVDTDSTAPYLSVPADAREKIYDAVPELEPLAYWLEEDAQLQNDFRDPNLDDYRAGSFYWAIRRAAQFEGIYADAKTADAYWQTVADKINAACAVVVEIWVAEIILQLGVLLQPVGQRLQFRHSVVNFLAGVGGHGEVGRGAVGVHAHHRAHGRGKGAFRKVGQRKHAVVCVIEGAEGQHADAEHDIRDDLRGQSLPAALARQHHGHNDGGRRGERQQEQPGVLAVQIAAGQTRARRGQPRPERLFRREHRAQRHARHARKEVQTQRRKDVVPVDAQRVGRPARRQKRQRRKQTKRQHAALCGVFFAPQR